MKNVANFIITFLVIIIGNAIAPTAIFINSWKDAVFASLIVLGFDIVTTLVVTAISACIMLTSDSDIIKIILVIVLIAISIAITFGGFILADDILKGFAVTNQALIILVIVNGMFSVSITSKKGE